MACDLCGKQGSTVHSKIEGVVYKVCEQCASFGEHVQEVRIKPKRAKKQEDLVVRADVAVLLRRAWNATGKTMKDFAQQLQVKESELHAWETGSRVPTIEQARDLERRLGISLVEASEVTNYDRVKSSSDAPLTIGDLLKLKK